MPRRNYYRDIPPDMPGSGGYRPRSGRTLADLHLEIGRAKAQGALDQGAIWGGAIQGIGDSIGGALETRAKEQEEKTKVQQMAVRDAALTKAIEEWDGKDPRALHVRVSRIVDPNKAMELTKGIVAFQEMGQKSDERDEERFNATLDGVAALPYPMFERWWPTIRSQAAPKAERFLGIPAAEVPEQATPELYETIRQLRKARQKPSLKAFKPGDVVIDENDPGAKPVLTVPPEQKPDTRGMDARLAEAAASGDQATYQRLLRAARESAAATRAPKEPRTDTEPLMAVIGDDGQPVYMARSKAEGRRPASNREQGRPVTAGDAGRIAELNTSLDDLRVLRQAVEGSKATGTAAKVGAMLPNVVTEATGIGAEAKTKQAVIDRVKQVIGKALEGGVLRKEDEYKYEKILPTIGDVPEVVKAKLDGLERAIALRRQRQLESMEDSGYDTGRFNERGAPAPPGQRTNPFR